MPLEEILNLTHPNITDPEPAEVDKRTWRVPKNQEERDKQEKEKAEITWTAMDIMTAYALKKGWATAQAGRPDVSRAGNASECLVLCPSFTTSFCCFK